MKRNIGFFGSYWLGLDPSKMPPWGVARSLGEGEAAAEVTAATVEERSEETEDMAVRLRGEDERGCSGSQV